MKLPIYNNLESVLSINKKHLYITNQNTHK